MQSIAINLSKQYIQSLSLHRMLLLQKNTAVVLLTLMLLKMMAIPLTCLQYKLNKDFIAANLCENKEQPQMHCEGKCQLKKQIEKSSDTPNPSGEKNNVKPSISDFFFTNKIPSFVIAIEFDSYDWGFYSNGYSHIYSNYIFHPPLKA